ncbi:uncharacterized protein LOC126272991 [Schistocerca gregaria]|uniref:uncharacterized protein LOC126272991 n=1 Tax=Schistocerca gregaria TaxID=7010 RepID=UPI00211E4ED4|nr:uncharacterized protein LOC126272991 [Schistocerca gregaria]
MKEQHKVRCRHNNKLKKLMSQIPKVNDKLPPTNHKFSKRLVNSTNIIFSDKEVSLLNKGLQHNITPSLTENNIKELIVGTKIACDTAKLTQNDQIAIGHKVNNFITKQIEKANNKNSIKHHDRTILKSVNKKLSDSKALVVKADKSNAIVVMYESEYVRKTIEFFSNNNIVEIKSDPTFKLQNKLKNMMKKSNFLLNAKDIHECTVMNPYAPRLRAQPKTHKVNCPIRPIVNSRSSPTYKISKKLNEVLSNTFKFEETYSVKNSYELINCLKEIQIPDTARFASLDITNLYTNIPVKETIEIIKNNLLKHKNLALPEIYEFIDLLTLVLSHNYFSFNNKMYQQKEGLAMGSCLASLLADIFINNLECKFFKENPQMVNKIIYYRRYVDDIIVLFDGTAEEIDNLAKEMNKMHQNIIFTVEHQTEVGLNFLDLCISSSNNKHKFQVYRKPTYTDNTINKSSCHPDQHKTASYRAMLNRMHKIPLQPADQIEELNTIKAIAYNNGYNPKLIDELNYKINPHINKHNNKTTLKNTTTQAKEKYVSLPFVGKLSYKIANLFRGTDIKISYYTNNKIKDKAIHNIKNNTKPYNQSGIYKLNCNSCPKTYIGQTGRNFSIRFREHMDALRLKNLHKSTFAQHVAEEEHQVTDISHNLQVLHLANKGKRMNLLEEIEIYSHKHATPSDILNDQTELPNRIFLKNFHTLLIKPLTKHNQQTT